MIRLFDIFFSSIGLIFFSPILILFLIVGWLDTGSPIFLQKRVGRKLRSFMLVKFRTMKMGTKSIGTHLVDKKNVTNFGFFLRKFKLDELPQLWNVFKGDMSIVGPRPCLPNQKKLIGERKKRGIFNVAPGITGLAQVKGITMSTPSMLASTDLKMVNKMNIFSYYYYIFITIALIFKGKM